MRKVKVRSIRLPIDIDAFLSVFSGTEAGLATTAAIITGLITSTDNRQLVITTALITILVQAFNAAIGHMSVERTSAAIERNHSKLNYAKPISDSASQFIAHLISSFIILTPTVVVKDMQNVLFWTIGVTLGLLFLLGLIKGYLVKQFLIREAFELVVLGSLIISIGIISGIVLG